MTHLKTGFRAPRFALPDQDGAVRSNADFRGRPYVLFFYPHDDDPTATAEAQAFAARADRFAAFDADVVGVSADPPERHHVFAQAHRIRYPLLADPDHRAARAFGVLRGDAPAFTSFLIDARGKVAATYADGGPHQVPQILHDLRHLK